MGTLLDDLRGMKRMDPDGMLTHCLELPDQIRAGWQWGLDWRLPARWRNLDGICLLGMGGSAIGADLANGFAGGKLARPLRVNRDYRLPGGLHRRTGILISSYSGNTEETLSAAEAALRRGLPAAAITSGGKLAALARRRRLPLVLIPSGLPPRGAVGYGTFVLMGLLRRLKWIPAIPVPSAAAGLERTIARSLAPAVPLRRNPAKQLARRLAGRIPILYGGADGWEGVTFRWRTQLEENAKTVCFHHIFPEATHNEISGWVHPAPGIRRTAAVFLTDPSVHPRTLKRMRFAARIIRREGAGCLEVGMKGPDRFDRMLRMIALGDFLSVYLAFLYRENPTPVVRVEALKKYLRSGR